MYGAFTSARFPRAHLDPIVTSHSAQLLLDRLIDLPHRHETLAVLLDGERRGVSIIAVGNTVDHDAVLDVAELVTESVRWSVDVDGVILASVRPGAGDELDDLERWAELSLRFDEAALELVEWYVIGNGVSCPRALLGEPPRWTL
ncbi:hypothetical protein [Ilumatobacter coccineus]|jgi:hypothetical protein|uniref:Uncharacterized protein n=1 Tax=Ilumatobacter coccineus (strain NBRC 103263 / KCTC 29153 / YM16-304) TaxID=1313172 RepID=A0A6C7EF39_ILUCY|nr:hypothetical protein [Ilumatobacter coccineus]BAN03238.1 hypothetical protein YM304_29240 [Ilumatobacter coccineus YM16-304]